MIQHFNKEFMSKNKEKYIQTFQKLWENLGSSSFYLVWFWDDDDDDEDWTLPLSRVVIRLL